MGFHVALVLFGFGCSLVTAAVHFLFESSPSFMGDPSLANRPYSCVSSCQRLDIHEPPPPPPPPPTANQLALLVEPLVQPPSWLSKKKCLLQSSPDGYGWLLKHAPEIPQPTAPGIFCHIVHTRRWALSSLLSSFLLLGKLSFPPRWLVGLVIGFSLYRGT